MGYMLFYKNHELRLGVLNL